MLAPRNDHIKIFVAPSRIEMGRLAAKHAGKTIAALQSKQEWVHIIFAAAPSQNEFLDALAEEQLINWQRVIAFQMDEYIGLADGAPQSFGTYLRGRLFSKVSIWNVFLINSQAKDVNGECGRYEDLIRQHPPDITCMGIGVNTHIAFNDPHVANFNDPLTVKRVNLDEVSRQQQVDDSCFSLLQYVPKEALTLTIPALLRAKHIYCVVPGLQKSVAVHHTLCSNINEEYPSTILRTHADVSLYLDKESAQLLNHQSE